jgi:hypothetical protein
MRRLWVFWLLMGAFSVTETACLFPSLGIIRSGLMLLLCGVALGLSIEFCLARLSGKQLRTQSGQLRISVFGFAYILPLGLAIGYHFIGWYGLLSVIIFLVLVARAMLIFFNSPVRRAQHL